MDKEKTKQVINDVYDRLLERYGPQHWWPGNSAFEVIIGAILTQNTAWQNVEKAIGNLKAAGALSARALREIYEDRLAELIRSSGYYNVKARKLKAVAEWLGKRCGDDLDLLFKTDAVALRKELLGVYGIGEETADSILLYAGGKPVFVIDAYTVRICERIGLAPPGGRYAGYQAMFTHNLPEDAALFNEYHALLVRLGKETCRKRPRCGACPLGGETPDTGYPCGQLPR